MDWDIEPTAFSEFVTIFKGSAPFLAFASPTTASRRSDPARPVRADLGQTGSFTDVGPARPRCPLRLRLRQPSCGRHPGVQDLLRRGSDRDRRHQRARTAVGVEALLPGRAEHARRTRRCGTPNTFLFAFRDTSAGSDVFTPNAGQRQRSPPPRTPPAPSTCSPTTPTSTATPLTVTGATNRRHGTVACTGPGVCTYTPAANYNGAGLVHLHDQRRARRHRHRRPSTITVTPVNDAPVAVDDTRRPPPRTPPRPRRRARQRHRRRRRPALTRHAGHAEPRARHGQLRRCQALHLHAGRELQRPRLVHLHGLRRHGGATPLTVTHHRHRRSTTRPIAVNDAADRRREARPPPVAVLGERHRRRRRRAHRHRRSTEPGPRHASTLARRRRCTYTPDRGLLTGPTRSPTRSATATAARTPPP